MNDLLEKYKFIKEYVERKVQTFLKINNLEGKYQTIQTEADKTKTSYCDYLSLILNNCIEEVAKSRDETFESIKEEFVKHYLS